MTHENLNLEPQLSMQVETSLRTITEEKLRPVLDALEAVESPDVKAGIYIAPFTNIEPVEVEGQIYRFYGARVLPGSHVNPHLHNHGKEPYAFVSGSGGEMNSGRVEGDRVVWDEPKIVVPGDIEVVDEGRVHCFRNTGKEPFDFTFACPDEHLIDRDEQHPEGDRYFTKGMVDGVPSWHPDAYPQA